MRKYAYFLFVTFTLFALESCGDGKPDLSKLTVIGTIDEDKYISVGEIYDMDFEQFKANYLGKEVTVTGLIDGKRTGGFNIERSQCVVSFNAGQNIYTPDFIPPENHKRVNIKTYTNHFPKSVILDRLGSDYPRDLIEYESEIPLPKTSCTKRCNWDENDKESCYYRSPDTIITGKIISAGQLQGSLYLTMLFKGIAY